MKHQLLSPALVETIGRTVRALHAVELIAKGKVRIQRLYKLLRLAGVERELHPRLQELTLRAEAQKVRKHAWVRGRGGHRKDPR